MAGGTEHATVLRVHPYLPGARAFTPPRGYADALRRRRSERRQKAPLVNYEREIRYTDDLLAGLLDNLDAHGLSERTIIVLTSDHGEGFGEHFWTGHGFDLHDEALLVPLVDPCARARAHGRVVDEQVGLIDLAPDAARAGRAARAPRRAGRSFARLLTGRGTPFEERPLMSVAFLGTESIRTRAYKYIK
jgi:arylsulfatase A-like enzyme